MDLTRNIEVAGVKYSICQDTGMAIIFIEVGQDVHFESGSLKMP